MRMKDKVCVVVGAGRGPGEGVGNGRATALLMGKEGGKSSPPIATSHPHCRLRQ